ncbi:MAG TPA: nidogen-like domain-containing protein [Bacteroidia bacterium]
MNKIILACFISLSFIGIKAQDSSPYPINKDNYHKLKKAGTLNGEEWFNPYSGYTKLQITNPANQSKKKGSHINNDRTTSTSACNGWIPRDTTFHPVPFAGYSAPFYSNDDGYTSAIILPFSFCLYGSTVGNASNPMYINNNGNISFGGAYSTYSPVGFPSSSYSMVAPFWGDVDTENPPTCGGVVWYKQTPTYLIVQWDSVGVFDHSTPAQINTFQLIITDGTDPILPVGNNISFCYGEMQWTTGDASNGAGTGFGGYPATVGINKGDGVNYIQISLFDNGGSVYTSPSGTPTASGVGWLANKSFYFNSCGSGSNLPPLSTSGGASACVGDTLNICAVGDTLYHTVTFTPPESNQSVTVTATAPGLGTNFSVISSTTGVTASLTFMVNSTGLTPGFYTVTVTGTDNGTPVLNTTLTYIIHILNAPIPNPIITVNPAITCGNTPPIITLTNSSNYDSWVWNTGAISPSYTTSVAVTTTVHITVTKNGCSKTGTAVAQVYPAPTVNINGALTYCPPSTNTLLQASGTSPVSYNWNNGLASTNTLSATGTPPTAYTVVVTDAHGCKDSASVTVSAGSTTPLTISSAGNLCIGRDTLFSSITNATSYTWSPGIGSPASTYTVSTAGNYSLALTINGCIITQTYSLSPAFTPTLSITPDTVICVGKSTTLTVTATPTTTAGYSYTWYNGSTVIATTNTVTLNTAGTSYSVTCVNNNTQCKSSKTFFINSYPNPSVSITGHATYCKGRGDTLIAVTSGGTLPYITYSWNPGALSTDTIVVTPSNTVTSVTYSVVVTDSKGCKAISFPKTIKPDKPHLTVPNYSVCPGATAVIHAHGTGTPPLTYTWYPGLVSGANYTTSIVSTYTVVMTDFYGCKDSVPVSGVQYPKPHASFNYSPSPAQQGTPTLFSNNSTVASPDTVKWGMWTFGDLDTVISNTNPTHTFANGGAYTVTLVVATNHGCRDTTHEVINIQFNIIAPNIITPNGDGINEYLAFKNLLYFNNNKIWIYNRWGTQLYQDNDYKNNWTGKDYSDGTYFYILEVPEKHQTFKGFFESIK